MMRSVRDPSGVQIAALMGSEGAARTTCAPSPTRYAAILIWIRLEVR